MISVSKILHQLVYDPKAPLLFNSGFFLYFLFFFMLLFYAVRHHKNARIGVFTFFSLYFFYKASGWCVSLVIASAIIDYSLSNLIYRQQNKTYKKLLLITSVMLNLGLLFYFKYTNFFIQLLNDSSFTHISPINLILPIGISFYTFENLSYTIDVYRGEFRPVTNFLDYLFFLSFFPKLIMGPIVRAADFIPQINKPYGITENEFARGFFLLLTGLFKKVVISDYINVNFVQYIFDDPSKHTGLECLLGVYGYALVIYCDFSGYSDMAIGLAQWLGFKVALNFNAPYKSASITEFWRRWHISLSSWLRDYLYIPLGGSRRGKWRTYINLLITMLLGGLWHGASWNFIIWGGLHGGMLAAERFRNSFFKPSGTIWKVAGILVTFHFVCFCWVFFKAGTLNDSLFIIKNIFSNFNAEGFGALCKAYSTVFMLMLLGFIIHGLPTGWSDRIVAYYERQHLTFYIATFLIFIFICLQVKTAEQVMPVYLQF